MAISEATITNRKKQLEFYKQLSEQLQQEHQQLKEQLQQRDEVIEEAIKINENIDNDLKCKSSNAYCELEDIIFKQYKVLTKYKGGNND